MGKGWIILGIVIIIAVIFVVLLLVSDISKADIPSKIINIGHNIKDGGIGIFLQVAKWGNIAILNQEGAEKAVKDIEEHNALYSFRNDKHKGCCKSAECYIKKVCISSSCVDCQKSGEDLIRYYA